jgi:hypothetical protein
VVTELPIRSGSTGKGIGLMRTTVALVHYLQLLNDVDAALKGSIGRIRQVSNIQARWRICRPWPSDRMAQSRNAVLQLRLRSLSCRLRERAGTDHPRTQLELDLRTAL